MLEWVKYPEDTNTTRTNYTYDSMYRMATAAATTDSGLALSAEYTYTDDLLTAIETGSTAYTFGYGDFALRSNVKIGSRTLASYSYTGQDHYLSSLDYGNEDEVQYTYDNLGRVTRQTYEDGATVDYRYDNNGALATVTDSATGRTTTYYYDFIDRMMKYVETGSGYSHSVGYEYDTINNLTKMVETINDNTYTYTYGYDDDNRVTHVTNTGAKRFYTYDAWGRVSEQSTRHSSTEIKKDTFSFTAPSGTATSSQIAGHTIDAADYDKTYTYTYDNNGNISSVSDGTNTTSYVYDSANQLIRENNEAGEFTHLWSYDNAGNILSRAEYDYTSGELGELKDTVSYSYGDTDWGDLLTAYDGNTITYDQIGNPLNDGTWTYTWQHGRQLSSMSDGTTTWNFTYNADGLRTKRTNGSTTYEYVYNGDKLSYMKCGSIQMYFIYDASGTPIAVRRNTTNYYYVTNIQGDVTAILNYTGTPVVEYTYDAWGNLISTTGSMATTLGVQNPLRYRGYLYDREYGLYYLQSRYYNPKTGRFLNADDSAFIGITGTLTSFNLFAYCENNPVKLIDSSGQFGLTAAVIATGAVVGGLLGAFNAATTGGNVLEAAIEGALTGLVGSACGLLISNPLTAIALAAAGGAVVDFATQATSQLVTKGTFSISQIDLGRIIKTAAQTGLGTAIPQLGNANKVATDAFGTALIWAEGSTLITAADVIVTNTINNTTKGKRTKSARRFGVSILERELLLT